MENGTEGIENKRKSPKQRSRRYPGMGLKSALEKAEMIYNKEHQAPCSREVIATNMGYTGLNNGSALRAVAALQKYGLLEGRGDRTQVSDRAVVIIAHPPGATERVQAIQEAANMPDLFKELDTRFDGGKASDGNIRSYLLTQKFTRKAADLAIHAYRETKDFLRSEQAENHGEEGGDSPDNEEVGGTLNDGEVNEIADNAEPAQNRVVRRYSHGYYPGTYPRRGFAPPRSATPLPPGSRRMVCPLDEGDVTITFPEKLSAESADDLRTYIDLFLKKVDRQVEGNKESEAADGED